MSNYLTNIIMKDEKDRIIKMYEDNVGILNIAKEYGVVETTICRRLKKWGIQVKRKAYYRRKKNKEKKFKREFSPELIAKMKENTRINNKYIKVFNTVETGKDKFLVRNILRRSEAVK